MMKVTKIPSHDSDTEAEAAGKKMKVLKVTRTPPHESSIESEIYRHESESAEND